MRVGIYKDTKRFNGQYVMLGGLVVEDDSIVVEISSLPPTEDLDKQKFHRLETREAQTGTYYVPVMRQDKDELGELLWEDDEKTIPIMIQEVDEDGELVFNEEPIMENISEWVFDEDDYNVWLEEQRNVVPSVTLEEKIEMLKEKNNMFSETLDYILTEIIPSI